MSLLNVIRRYATGPIPIRRTAVGTVVDGQYTPGLVTGSGAFSSAFSSAFDVDVPFTTDPIYTSVQPITGEELKDLPEGQRTEDSWYVWTTTLLLARSDANDPDVLVGGNLTPDGRGLPAGNWRVEKVEGPFRLISGHYRVTVSKVDIQ